MWRESNPLSRVRASAVEVKKEESANRSMALLCLLFFYQLLNSKAMTDLKDSYMESAFNMSVVSMASKDLGPKKGLSFQGARP